ncbi:MAG: hypothetical protein QOD51_33 [Candidatus Eremiobacteraeota bacterium]|jgi:predicted ABC-type ATPase|nr:hypothetical protein [Candidatus Eremiobacteraeota bacterium]
MRITERVMKGGHDVPQADLLRRFRRSNENLEAAIALADDAVIYDNSTLGGLMPIARFFAGALVECAPDVPRWVRRAIGSSLPR